MYRCFPLERFDFRISANLFYLSQNADQIERLNEVGELRIMLKPYKVISKKYFDVLRLKNILLFFRSVWIR